MMTVLTPPGLSWWRHDQSGLSWWRHDQYLVAEQSIFSKSTTEVWAIFITSAIIVHHIYLTVPELFKKLSLRLDNVHSITTSGLLPPSQKVTLFDWASLRLSESTEGRFQCVNVCRLFDGQSINSAFHGGGSRPEMVIRNVPAVSNGWYWLNQPRTDAIHRLAHLPHREPLWNTTSSPLRHGRIRS